VQLSLRLAEPLPAEPPVAGPDPTAAERLVARLRALGLPPFERISTHRNEQVMLSWVPERVLRVHLGYTDAPDEVLQAIVRFVTPGTRRPLRLAARRVFLGFPADEHAPRPARRRRPERLAPGDANLLLQLEQLREQLNREHFGGDLRPIPIRVSRRMRTRLGELRLDRRSGEAVHIGISRRHARRDGWAAVRETLLHELVHQWQAETGRPVDHGPEFRRKARELGIQPRAVRLD